MQTFTENPWKMTKKQLFNHIVHILHQRNCTIRGWFQGDPTGSDLVECVLDNPLADSQRIMALKEERVWTFCKSEGRNRNRPNYVLREQELREHIIILINLLADFDEGWLFSEGLGGVCAEYHGVGGRILFSMGDPSHSHWELVKVIHLKKTEFSIYSSNEIDSRETK